LQKGIIDGTVCPLETLKTMRLAEVAGYFTLIPSARGAYPSKAFNWDSWKKLPPDIQKIFEDNGDWHGLKIVEEFIKKDEEGLAFAKEQGVEFIKPLKSEVDKWVEMMNVNSIKVSKELDAKGLPGTKIFNRIHQLINE
jgi:TRAP-type transport system periplasmic protein